MTQSKIQEDQMEIDKSILKKQNKGSPSKIKKIFIAERIPKYILILFF